MSLNSSFSNNFNVPPKEPSTKWPKEGFFYNGKTVYICLNDLTYGEIHYVLEHAKPEVIEQLFENTKLRENKSELNPWIPQPFNGWVVTKTGIEGSLTDKKVEIERNEKLYAYRWAQKIVFRFNDSEKRIAYHPYVEQSPDS